MEVTNLEYSVVFVYLCILFVSSNTN